MIDPQWFGPPRTTDFGLRPSVERTGAENASTRIHFGVPARSTLVPRLDNEHGDQPAERPLHGLVPNSPVASAQLTHHVEIA